MSLGHLPGGLHSVGTAINNNTFIVGTASLADGSFTAMLWHAGVMHNIGIFSGGTYTAAEAINDSDQVIGWGFTNSSRTKTSAFYWTNPGFHVLTTLGGDQTYAWGISAKGFIAGHSQLPGDTATHAVLWNSYTSTPTDLGTLPGGVNSYARGLNNALQVVGYADVP
jgi:probable HAF family extracellular repeat protein